MLSNDSECLLCYALNISWKDKIPNIVLYEGISKISDRLRERRLKFAGHCFRCYQFTPQPIMDLILWRYKGKVARGASNRQTFIKLLCEDRGLSFKMSDIDTSITSLKIEMRNRATWRSIVYIQINLYSL